MKGSKSSELGIELRILFLHEVSYFEKPIFEMHEFPENLAKRGHEIAFADYLESDSFESVHYQGQLRSGRVIESISFQHFYVRANLPGVFGRLVAVPKFFKFFDKLYKEFKPDLVVSFAVPTSGWQALIVCRRHGIPYVFRALDVSHKIRKSIFAPIIMIAEKFIYKNASWISCNNAALLEYCISLGGKRETTSVELPPLDLSHFLDSGPTAGMLRAQIGIPEDKTVLLYMGSFFYFSGLDVVLRELRKIEDRPFLVLVGGGEQDAQLRKLVIDLDLEDSVMFTGFVEFEALPAYLSTADVAINPMAPSLVSETALPNKVLQYMASGLPVVSTKLKGLSSLIDSTSGLVLVSTPAEVLKAAISLSKEPNLSERGHENRQTLQKKFVNDAGLIAFERLLEKVREPR